MQVTDIAKLLEGYGFTQLVPTNVDKNVFTFKFGKHNYNLLLRTFGQPSVAAGGKVAVFEFPGYGRLGVSPSNSVVRLVYTGNHAKVEHKDSHLAKLEVTKELELLFARAQINKAARLKYLEEAFSFFNKKKFSSQLPKTKITSSEVEPRLPGIDKKTRAFFAARKVNSYYWFRDRLFNSSIHFVNEILVHEMCHARTFIELGTIETEENGHGPVWQKWMRKVGLDPRRYDPTDNYTYMNSVEQNLQEEEYASLYGPRTNPSFFKTLTPAKEFIPGLDYVFLARGRAFTGKFARVGGKYNFRGKAPNGKVYAFKLSLWTPDNTWIKD